MFNFFKECVKKYKIRNPYTENLEKFFPCITLTVNEGVNGISTLGGFRTSEFLASFTSWAKDNDYIGAYNKLNELKNNLLIKDIDYFKKLGYEVDNIHINPIKEIFYIENEQTVFRYNWDLLITYKQKIEVKNG